MLVLMENVDVGTSFITVHNASSQAKSMTYDSYFSGEFHIAYTEC